MGILNNRKTKKNDTPAKVENKARPLADVRSEITRLEAEQGELELKRDQLIGDIARDWDSDTSDVQAEVGRLDIKLGALRRRLEWQRRDLYWANLESIITGYRRACVTRWTATALQTAEDAAVQALRAKHKAEMEALQNRANAALWLAHRAGEDATKYVSLAVQRADLGEDDTRELYDDLRGPIAAIDAEYGHGMPQGYEPPAELAAELLAIIEANTTPTPALVSEGLPPAALAALEAARANL